MHTQVLRPAWLTAVLMIVLLSGATVTAHALTAGSHSAPATAATGVLHIGNHSTPLSVAANSVGAGIAEATIPTSNDPSQVPVRQDVSATYLAPSDQYVPAGQAITAAEGSFGVTDSDVLRAVEVSATASDGIPRHSDEPVWVVIAKYDTPAPLGSGYWSELCIVVDAVTGAYQYAYPTDLSSDAHAAAARAWKRMKAERREGYKPIP